MRELNGMPAEVREDRELVELMLPIVRADFNVTETYAHRGAERLAYPVSVFVGTHDREAGPAEAWAWARQTPEPLSVRVVDGDHFYLHTHLQAVRQTNAARLDGQRAA